MQTSGLENPDGRLVQKKDVGVAWLQCVQLGSFEAVVVDTGQVQRTRSSMCQALSAQHLAHPTFVRTCKAHCDSRTSVAKYPRQTSAACFDHG
jgi:hypothetical protein